VWSPNFRLPRPGSCRSTLPYGCIASLVRHLTGTGLQYRCGVSSARCLTCGRRVAASDAVCGSERQPKLENHASSQCSHHAGFLRELCIALSSAVYYGGSRRFRPEGPGILGCFDDQRENVPSIGGLDIPMLHVAHSTRAVKMGAQYELYICMLWPR